MHSGNRVTVGMVGGRIGARQNFGDILTAYRYLDREYVIKVLR
jgi:hypothetical protein